MAVGTGTALLAGAAVGGSVLSGRNQAKAAESAAEAQERAALEGLDSQERALERTIQIGAPFREAGLSAADPLLQELGIGPGGIGQQELSLPGNEIFNNPLLNATRDDITRRIMSNQAAGGFLGSGGTIDAVTQSLAPQALSFGLSLQSAREAQKQQRIQNLFNMLGLGANVSAGQGTAIQQTGQGVAQSLNQAGAAQAQGALGRGQAISNGIADVAGLATLGAGGFFSPQQAAQPQFLGGGLPFQSSAVGNIA